MTAHLPGKFVWFEHVSTDPARARAFYEPLVGWHVEVVPMPGGGAYHRILNGPDAIGGLRAAEPTTPSHWASYLSVDDVDARHAAALAAGARSLQAPTDYGAVGRAAVVEDPTGAALCLWRGADGDRPDRADVPAGDWVWNELWTPDAPAALAFYERVFGYRTVAMDMGEQRLYHLLMTGEQRRAGLMQSTLASAPAMWLPYLRVADCDAIVGQAGRLGARQVVVPPTDIPNVGRFAVLIDPLGAAIALLQTAMPA